MPEPFLYGRLEAASRMGFLQKEIPEGVVRNLNLISELRLFRFFYENPIRDEELVEGLEAGILD